ncbi:MULTISPECIES: hypothetical protein [unclassified Nocardia]|uniref:hypothetical protein n=1 Tax=unclassified Nocardia TaxID=2637762 RepID=UPI001CE3D077|nr:MULTISPECIES: hypothetical protein [unclassified Nocardia]
MTETALDIDRIVARYVEVWNEPDAGARRALVEQLWTPDGVEFVDGGVQFRGYAELTNRVTEAYLQFVATGDFTVVGAGDVTVHDDIVTFTSQLVADGDAAWAARVFLLLDEDGRIREDYHLTVLPLPPA